MSVGGNYRNEEFELVKEERDRFQEEITTYKLEKEQHKNTQLEKYVVRKAMTVSLMDPERSVTRLKIEKSLLLKTNEELFFLFVATDYKRLSDYGNGVEK